jgi:signal peptide peptidase SppA
MMMGEQIARELVALIPQSRAGVAVTRPTLRREANVAVLPLLYFVSQRPSFAEKIGLGTSIESFAAMFKRALTDPSVDRIVIDIDSHGGELHGVEELAQLIFGSRGIKRIHAHTAAMMADVSYWIGSAAHEVSASSGAEVGSIGVFATHTDESRALAKQGIGVTLISAGRYKSEDSPYEPLTTEAKTAMQRRIDSYYSMFIARVASNRGVSQATVRERFGRGRLLSAQDAVKVGMVDRIETLDQLLARIGGAK